MSHFFSIPNKTGGTRKDSISHGQGTYCRGTIPDYFITIAMPAWNCKKCDMSLTTTNPDSYMSCPQCGKRMFQVE